ncbi:MAG TPA: Ran-binding zinc finger domain-containing protein [Gemmatimonadaceae bacterium]|nr:Ran-binding zinc finger domain-containing protein [Gemmatimonadaceae bacterium]
MEQLTAFMEERARYEGWLSQLEARRDSTPPHVFDRVSADYRERLQRVTEQLSSRAGDLENSAASLASRIAALFTDESTRKDERAEAELRALVGEFTEDHARDVVARCDEAIATLVSDREAVAGELTRVQQILAVARPGAVVAPPPQAMAPAVENDDTIVPIESLAPAEARDGAEPAASTAAFDELAFLQSVVHNPPASAPAPEATSPRAEERQASDAAATNGAGSNAHGGAASAESLGAPNRAPTPILSRPPISEDAALPQSTLTPGSIPAFLKDMPTEQIKTLKCQECGTMNYPTEWYCERCGGELAAM